MPYVKRTGMRKRSRPRVTGRKNYAKKGLTKTEKTQVKTIAKRAVNSLAETKYFHTKSYEDEAFNWAWYLGGNQSQVGAVGFTTGFEKAMETDGSQDAYKYGVNSTGGAQNMNSLEMNRVFLSNAANPQGASYAIEGSMLRPSYNESKWLLNRIAGNTTAVLDHGLPYRVRMLRLRPKSLKGSYQLVNPAMDAFLDQFNREFGISTLDDQGAPMMTEFNINLAKANNRKYIVIEDTQMVINPPMTYDTINDNGAITYVARQTSNTQRQFTKTHKIGTELFYPDTTAETTASTLPKNGFIPEFILFHVVHIGTPSDPANRLRPDQLSINCRPVSTFKDI